MIRYCNFAKQAGISVVVVYLYFKKPHKTQTTAVDGDRVAAATVLTPYHGLYGGSLGKGTIFQVEGRNFTS